MRFCVGLFDTTCGCDCVLSERNWSVSSSGYPMRVKGRHGGTSVATLHAFLVFPLLVSGLALALASPLFVVFSVAELGFRLGTAVLDWHSFPLTIKTFGRHSLVVGCLGFLDACCYVTWGLEFGTSNCDGVSFLKFDGCELVLSLVVYTRDKVLSGRRPREVCKAPSLRR